MMEEEKDTGQFSPSDDDSSQGLPEYDVAAQEPTRWSELASLPPEGRNETSLEMSKIGSVCVAKGSKTNSSGVQKSNVRSQKICLQQKSDVWSQKTCLQLCEVLILAPAMLVIIGLLLIPTVFYVLPSQELVNEIDSDCLQVETYSGEICRDTLTSLQTCFSGVTSPPPALNIPSLIDQQTRERDAMRLVNGLSFINPSPECRVAITPFLCLSIFSLCDSSNHLHTILREDCLELRDDICAEEWSQAVVLLGAGVLPVCENLPDISNNCTGNRSFATPPPNTEDTGNQTKLSPSNQTVPLVCSEGFFFDENVTNLCKPECGVFNSAPLSLLVVERITISACFIASMIMFILALTVQREILLVFPSILFVYMCITTFIASGMLIVGFFDNPALFCRSRDLTETLEQGNETPFCILSGFVFSYCLEQICMWALLHAIFLLWAVRFPISYRQLRISGRIRYAHVIAVILAVVLPLFGPCMLLRGGYRTTATPTFACAGRNLDFTYYSIILPVSFVVGLTSCVLVLLLWTLFKEFVLKNLLRRTKVGQVNKAQLKVSVIIIYYTLIGVVGLVVYTHYEANDIYREGITDYILCESSGPSECVLDLGFYLNVVDFLSAAVIVMIAFLPVLAILFSCNPQACKKACKRRSGTDTRASFVRSHMATSQIDSKS